MCAAVRQGLECCGQLDVRLKARGSAPHPAPQTPARLNLRGEAEPAGWAGGGCVSG